MRRDILSYFRGLYEGPVVYSQNLVELSNSLTAFLAREGVVGTVTRLWAGDKTNRVRVPNRSKEFLFRPQSSDTLWGPPSSSFNGHHGLFPRKSSSRGVMLETHPL
jgi:hypothetical protein